MEGMGGKTRRGFLGLFLAGLAGLSALAAPAEAQTPPRTVGNHLIPSRDNQYNLGSKNKRWRSLHTGPDSIQVWKQPTDSQPAIKLTTETITDPDGNSAEVGSIQLGDGSQLKVSITGGGAGELEEEVVIKSLLPNKGTGLNIVANGTNADPTTLGLVPKDDWSEIFYLAAYSDDTPHMFLSFGNSLKPIKVTWLDTSGWKPSVVFRHFSDGTTLMDIESDASGKETLTLGVTSSGEPFIDQSYDPGNDGSANTFWLGGWFNRQTSSFTPLFRCFPPEIPDNYTVAQLGNRNSFQYDEWLTLLTRHEDGDVEHGIDVNWNSNISGSKPGIIYLGGWFDSHTSNFQPGITQDWTGNPSDNAVTQIHTDTIIGANNNNSLTIKAASSNINIENAITQSSAGLLDTYLEVKVGGQTRLIPLYAPP